MKKSNYRIGFQFLYFKPYRELFIGELKKHSKFNIFCFLGNNNSVNSKKKKYDITNGNNISIDFLKSNSFFWQFGIFRWFFKYKPQVIVLTANYRIISNCILILICRLYKVKVIGWGIWPKQKSSLFNAYLRLYALFFDAIVTYGYAQASHLKKIGVNNNKIFTAPNSTMNPVDSFRFTAKGSSTSKKNLIYVGRLEKRKKVDYLLKSLSSIRNNFSLTIVGDGPELENLSFLANKFKLNVNFTGQLTGDKLARQYFDADLLVLPGTGGLVVQEALSYGLPLIVGESDGTQIGMVTPKNGWILDDKNTNSLRDILTEVGHLSDYQLYKMGQYSLQLAQNIYRIDNMVISFNKVIHKLLEDDSKDT